MVVRGEATVSQLDAALMHGIGPRFSAVGLFGGYVLNMRDADPDAWLTHIAAFDFGRDLVHGEPFPRWTPARSEEHTSELQSLMRISYAVFCLKKKTK